MTESQQEAQRWLDYASQDFDAAMHLASSMRPCPYEIVCFHCQQAAEKVLKAYLVSHGKDIPRTHDLSELCRICFSDEARPVNIFTAAARLTSYAVQARYPNNLDVTEADSNLAIEDAKVLMGFADTFNKPEQGQEP